LKYINDPEISLRSKGIMSILETRMDGDPGEIDFSIDTLIGKEGRDAKRNAINELINKGYLEAEITRNEFGQITGKKYTVNFMRGNSRCQI
jgi:hypothetical protein